jgi:hypothetical protein
MSRFDDVIVRLDLGRYSVATQRDRVPGASHAQVHRLFSNTRCMGVTSTTSLGVLGRHSGPDRVH